jgi:hypothetical protein
MKFYFIDYFFFKMAFQTPTTFDPSHLVYQHVHVYIHTHMLHNQLRFKQMVKFQKHQYMYNLSFVY